MTVQLTLSFDRAVPPDELRSVVEQINLREGLEFVTKWSARAYREPNDELISAVNPLNLSLLAKAFALWGNPEGRPIRRTDEADTDERLWLIKASNSLPWHSRRSVVDDYRNTMISYFIRQAHMIVATDDPLDANVARTYAMFHDIIGRGGFPVLNPSAELEALSGVTAEDLWVLTMAIFSFYVSYGHVDPRVWIFRPDFVQDSPRAGEINAVLRRVLERVARTPEELRVLYNATPSKYRDTTGVEGYWISEFNILRDFPIIRLSEDEYCAPFPPFAFVRGSAGFYFDILDEYARRERENNPRNPNPYDNAMNRTLGGVFQAYVGDHLKLLPGADESLLAEFRYGKKGNSGDTPDWILARPERIPVFFECKARRPTLGLQCYAREQDIDEEITRVVARALAQFTEFISRADAGIEKIAKYGKLPRYIYTLVLYEPFAFHALREIRERIEEEAIRLDPRWNTIRGRVLFVPMWIRELETAVGLELERGISIEEQLERYATYRMTAEVDQSGPLPVFPRHLEEFLQEQWNNSRRIVNPLCQAYWDAFCSVAYERIFDENLDAYEAKAKHRATEKIAYRLWVERGRPLWDADTDWRRAEEILDADDDPLAGLT